METEIGTKEFLAFITVFATVIGIFIKITQKANVDLQKRILNDFKILENVTDEKLKKIIKRMINFRILKYYTSDDHDFIYADEDAFKFSIIFFILSIAILYFLKLSWFKLIIFIICILLTFIFGLGGYVSQKARSERKQFDCSKYENLIDSDL